MYYRFIIATIFLLFFDFTHLYSKTIKGQVTEVSSNDPIPFATIYIKGTDFAVQSDFEGYYTLDFEKEILEQDSIICMADGYANKIKSLKNEPAQLLNFQMDIGTIELETIVIGMGEDPAYNMIRKALEKKDLNNKKNLNAYEYESYTKIELAIDNISEKMKHRRAFKQIGTFMDSLKKIAGEDGKPILPIYISENISKVYFKNNMPIQSEKILASKVNGVGVKDGSLVSQIIGSSFVEYNFYNEYIFILGKPVPTPLSNSWKLYYKYTLLDSSFIDNEWCYKIDVRPKNKLDLAFKGNIWLVENTWAIKRADLSIGKEANINFIDKIRIQQESEKSGLGPYFPIKGRVFLDIAELADSSAGMLAKYYYSCKDIIYNKPHDEKYYKTPISIDEKALYQNEDYWLTHRHDTLTETEISVFKAVDSLKKLPVVKTYTEILDIALNGYKKIGKFDFGPYLYLYSNNEIEGSRFRMGLRTNIDFSNKYVFKGFLAYGTKDAKFKYGIGMKYIFSRKQWTEGEINYSYDLNQLAFFNNDKEDFGLFSAFTRWGQQRRPFYTHQLKLNFNSELFTGFSVASGLKMRDLDPLFHYAHFNNFEDTINGGISKKFANTEASLSIRYAYREILLQNDNERISLGPSKNLPVITMSCVRGIKGVDTPFGKSQFSYTKVGLRIQQYINVSFLGVSSFDMNTARYLNPLPYPLLTVHQGNETVFMRSQAFNLMNFFEFISDRYITLAYNHNFNGFFMNRLPLMKKLKLREFCGLNLLRGSVRPENQLYIPKEYEILSDGKANYQGLGTTPYVEINYGVENIFKFLRIDFIHRLTYRNVNYKINTFGVKLSAQFKI